MDKLKATKLIKQLSGEAKTCAIMVQDSNGYSVSAVKGTPTDVFNHVLAMVYTVLRKDPFIPPREHVGKIVTGLLLVAEKIEHEKKPTAAVTDVSAR